MQEIAGSMSVMDFLTVKEAAFRKNAPGLGCVTLFFAHLKKLVLKETPERLEAVCAISERWETKGIAARARQSGAEINWASPIILEDLFLELRNAINT